MNQKKFRNQSEITRIAIFGIRVSKDSLAIALSGSSYTNLKYNKLEMYKKINSQLKEIDEEYRTTIINILLKLLQWLKLWKWIKPNRMKWHHIYLFNIIN